MLMYIVLSFLIFCIGVLLVVVAWVESKRDDVVIIDDTIDRERVGKFLRLSEESKQRIADEIDMGLHNE